MLVNYGRDNKKLVQNSINDLKEKRLSRDELALPSQTEEDETAERTRRALESILDGKIKSSKANNVSGVNQVADASYIRYTPNPNAPG
jgi:SNW domain-containing protein 1